MKQSVPLLAVLAAAALLLLRPEAASQAVGDGLALCASTVIPALFPFFAVVSLLLQLGLAGSLQGLCAPFMGPVFHLRGVCALPLLTGLLGGYPSGARTAADLCRQGLLTRREAELLLGFCDNCGPGFLLGYVGAGILGSARAGAYLFLIHVCSALLVGMFLCRLCGDRGSALLGSSLPARVIPFPQALTAAVSGALASTLSICAFVVLFRVLAALPPVRLPVPLLGALEMVTGTAALAPG
ncbi:MAG: sporulation protein, partial [Oscillospiraceae bacterium]|nr:sporulation protein [Oscillospiraceae bacterium]